MENGAKKQMQLMTVECFLGQAAYGLFMILKHVPEQCPVGWYYVREMIE